jgi:hypothetical protein
MSLSLIHLFSADRLMQIGARRYSDRSPLFGLSTVFGLPDLTGATVGVATVSPGTASATPEPAAVALLALGLPIALLARRGRVQ